MSLYHLLIVLHTSMDHLNNSDYLIIINYFKEHTYIASTCISNDFPDTSVMLSLPFRSPRNLMLFVRMASRMVMQEKALHASPPQMPCVATASGMHCQLGSEYFVSLRSYYNVAEALPSQLETKMSAGLV